MNTLLSAAGVLATMEPRLFDLDFQLFHDAALMIIAVVALFLIMSYFLFNPARAFLQKRQDKIRTELEDAKTNQEDACALKAEYDEKLRNVEKEAEGILADARKRALANENRIVAEAKEEAAAIVERAREEAKLEKTTKGGTNLNTLINATGILATMEPRLFDLDFQLFHDAVLMIIAVVALFLIMSYFLFNPARAFLEKRQEKIRTELEDAKNNQEEAHALKKEYESKLKNIDKEAESILADARKRALANENRIVAAAKEEAAAIIERAREEAKLEKQKLADEVKKEIVAVAALMAGKVVASSVDVTIQDSLIDETLKEIGDSTWLS